ncbi:hypothetical protein H7X46_00115 [Pseudonocardia sp. C8]|nr:hypothetical protein [Pseudonocardia sp. C8]MBC3189474.1 hypothetical protein [Pseudonocardia sp. C8]
MTVIENVTVTKGDAGGRNRVVVGGQAWTRPSRDRVDDKTFLLSPGQPV